MSDARPNYKRSWRNLLLNKSYQLRFTLFMVGLSTVLMVGLGIWVMTVANETTKVARTSVMGTPCPPIPELVEQPVVAPPPAPASAPAPAPAPAPAGEAPAPGGEDPAPAQGDGSAAAAGSAAGSAAAAAAGVGSDGAADDEDDSEEARRKKIVVNLDPIQMAKPRAKVLPPDFAAAVVKRWTCELKIDAALEGLDRGRLRILWVLIGTGLLLVLGLAVYGIKTTHKVAGPLFKVSLYLQKMRDGRLDKVYNLRRGDQLVEFYEHFKHAHAGVVKLQQADIDRLRAVIAAAESAGAGESPAVSELRALLARKEKSIE